MRVREGGRVVNAVVLVATGVNGDGHREVLGMRVATSETRSAWNEFFADLVARGLGGVRLVTSDAHPGLVEAIAANLPGASWQRCRTHYAANLMSVTPKSMSPAVKAMPHSVYDQPDTPRSWPSSTGSWSTSNTSCPQRIVAHVGSAHTQAELGVLLERARELLEDPAQDVLDLDLEAAPVVTRVVEAPRAAALSSADPSGAAAGSGGERDSRGRVVSTDSRLLFEALGGVFSALGFDALGDPVFTDLVIARVVEPTSLLDVGRVLTDLGRAPAS
jgi:hypothetical protein